MELENLIKNNSKRKLAEMCVELHNTLQNVRKDLNITQLDEANVKLLKADLVIKDGIINDFRLEMVKSQTIIDALCEKIDNLIN